MNKKTLLAAVLIIAVLAGLGYYFGGESLQGRFDKTVSDRTTKGPFSEGKVKSDTSESVDVILTVDDKDGGTQTIDLSELAGKSDDEMWYTVGYWTLEYAADVSSCSKAAFIAHNGTRSYGLEDLSSPDEAEVRLLIRDGSGTYLGATYEPSHGIFSTLPSGNEGTYQYQLDVKGNEGMTSGTYDIYLSMICAEKDSTNYDWYSTLSDAEKAYFEMNLDSKAVGTKGGKLIISE